VPSAVPSIWQRRWHGGAPIDWPVVFVA
jgi:hypothetical protein